MSSFVRPNVLGMTPYSPGRPIEQVQRELGLNHVVKLASNENPLGPSPMALKAVREAAESMHLYPDAAAHRLTLAIAEKFGVEPNQVMLGNGSDELIHMIGLLTLGEPSDEIIVGKPSFVRYNAAGYLAPCQVIEVPVNAQLELDLDQMVERLTPHTKLVWLANPNNPTGTVFSKGTLDRLLEKLPSGARVVLDEAYFEFAAGMDAYPNSVDYVKAGAPVIGLRTFSKAYGLAGIRVGYGFASAEIIDGFHRAREPFNVNSLAQAAAISALQDDAHLARSVQHNEAMLQAISEAFREVGAAPYPSCANFVLADMGEPAEPIFEALLRKGVIVRSGKPLGLPNFLRVSVGTEDEIRQFRSALHQVVKERQTV